jgi:acyl-coenzyme A thioesterase PaaI-like protein
VEVRTHTEIDRELCGHPVDLGAGRATVRLRTTRAMAADERGLVHGGFVFGLADHAAMLAVNDPLVVLGSGSLRFVAPVVVDDTLDAVAEVQSATGKRHDVRVTVSRGETLVAAGDFVCFVPARHVLDSTS